MHRHDAGPTVRIARVAGIADDIPLPRYATGDSSGLDIAAAVAGEETIAPGARALIPTGFTVEIPRGYEGQIRARSGLALRHGIGIINAPGTIDADYRGEIKIILANFGAEPFTVRRGDRIAQLVIAPVARVTLEEVPSVESTARGDGGFGHTGRR